MNPEDFPAPKDGFVITHFLVVSDQDRSREFYQSLFDGQVLLERDPVIMKVANTWLILNVGGGPTDDKPTVTLTTPPDPNRTSAFLNIRVADIDKTYKEWSAKRPAYSPDPAGDQFAIRQGQAGASPIGQYLAGVHRVERLNALPMLMIRTTTGSSQR